MLHSSNVRASLVVLLLRTSLCCGGDAAAADEPLPQAPELRGDVTIARAIEASLQYNPDLAASRVDIGIREALTLQAGLRPNPTVDVQVEDIGGPGDRPAGEPSQTTWSLGQLFELGGKRALRRHAADLAREATARAIEVQGRELIAAVAQHFAGALLAQERLRLLEDLLRIAEGSVGTVEATVKAGAVSPVELSRAQVNFSRAQAARIAVQRELASARALLASDWGDPSPSFDRVVGRLEPIPAPPSLEALLPLIADIPDLARLEAELAQRRAALAVERSRRIPNLTLTAGPRQYGEDGGAGFVFGFSVPVPVFDNNRGNILAASREVTKARLEQQAGAVTAEARARQAHTALVGAFRQAAMLREQTIPDAERAYEGAKDAYTRGLFRFLEVLDAQRTLFELRSEHLNVLADYYAASAELNRWVNQGDQHDTSAMTEDDHD